MDAALDNVAERVDQTLDSYGQDSTPAPAVRSFCEARSILTLLTPSRIDLIQSLLDTPVDDIEQWPDSSIGSILM